MADEISTALDGFSPITLDKMGKVRLMNRVDTKYVTTQSFLIRFLDMAAATGQYFVVENDGGRNLPYSTRYFDTEDCSMYCRHETGRAVRQKVRLRRYDTSDTTFLEIKNKNNKGRTKKKRTPFDQGEDLKIYSDFFHKYCKYEPETLIPQVENHFHRITLVSNTMTERLTIDTGLSFHNVATGLDADLDGIVIIELKRDGNQHSPTAQILQSLHIHASGFSKYCIGMALTNSNLRNNRLKPRLRMVQRMLNNDTAPRKQHEVLPFNI